MNFTQFDFRQLCLLVKSCICACIGIGVMGATATSAFGREVPERSEKAKKALSKYEVTGEMKSCMPLRQIKTISALDDYHFLVRLSGNKYFLNVTTNRCFGASRPNTRLQYMLSQNLLCRNEIIRIVDNGSGFQRGSCGLSDFQELRAKPVVEKSIN